MADTLLNYETLPFRSDARLRVDRMRRQSRRQVSQTGSRNAQRNQRDNRPFTEYECTCLALTDTEMNDLTKFWEAHMFDENEPVTDSDAFLFKDNTHTNEYQLDGEQIGTGDGSKTKFQADLELKYGDRNYTRNVTYIKENSETVKVGGSSTTNYDIDYNTGIITFDSAPADGDAVTLTCDYYKKVIFVTSSWDASLNGSKWDVSFTMREVL